MFNNIFNILIILFFSIECRIKYERDVPIPKSCNSKGTFYGFQNRKQFDPVFEEICKNINILSENCKNISSNILIKNAIEHLCLFTVDGDRRFNERMIPDDYKELVQNSFAKMDQDKFCIAQSFVEVYVNQEKSNFWSTTYCITGSYWIKKL